MKAPGDARRRDVESERKKLNILDYKERKEKVREERQREIHKYVSEKWD